MSDNSSVPVASGNETFANEDIGGVKYPTPKLAWGPNGTANRVDTASGKALPVQVRSATGLIPIGEPTDAANTATDTTSVSVVSLLKQLSSYLGTLAGAVGSSKVATKAASGDFADGAISTLGAKTDAAATQTDTTSVSAMSVWKQISASIQAIAGTVSSSKVATKAASGDFADGAIATLGTKADAKSASTDTTSITVMQVIKQISASIQAAAASLAGTLTVGNSALTDFGAGEYETVAASASDQALGATGAAGDYLSGLLIVPATTSPGAVSIKDGSGSSITVFTGGASSVSNLVPFFVPLGLKSNSGAWKVTTGTNVSVIGCGNFT